MSIGRADAIDYLETIVSTVETDLMPVPVRELWVYGEIALGLDPVNRVNIYVNKDILLSTDKPPDSTSDYEVKGIGQSVRKDWADTYPHYIRTNTNGYAAPEKCLGAHLLPPDQPFHLEVCNTGFEDNVSQRLAGAEARNAYEEILDPRGVCLWKDGTRSPTAIDKLRTGEYVFPTLAESLEMLGMNADDATIAASTLQTRRNERSGPTIRGDVV